MNIVGSRDSRLATWFIFRGFDWFGTWYAIRCGGFISLFIETVGSNINWYNTAVGTRQFKDEYLLELLKLL